MTLSTSILLTTDQIFDGRALFVNWLHSIKADGTFQLQTSSVVVRAKDGAIKSNFLREDDFTAENSTIEIRGDGMFLVRDGKVFGKVAPAAIFDLRDELRASGHAGKATNLTNLRTAMKRPYGNSQQIACQYDDAIRAACAALGKTPADFIGLKLSQGDKA